MHYLLIRNAKIPQSIDSEELCSVLIADGRIVGMGRDIQHPLTDTVDLDANGRYVLPSLVSLCKPRPINVDDDHILNLNFENSTAGITSIMTVSADIEDNINDLAHVDVPLLNYAYHFPIRQVSLSNGRNLRRVMLLHGVSTAIARLGDDVDEKNLSQIFSHITAARVLGLRVLFDLRGVVDRDSRLATLQELCRFLRQDVNNRAYIVGVEYEDELEIVKRISGCCNLSVHLSFDPFAHDGGLSDKISPQSTANALRDGEWCSLGLAYSAEKALKERWPDMTPEIVSRNKLPLLNAIDVDQRFSPAELADFVMTRPATLLGLSPNVGVVREGALANLIIWDHDLVDDARFAVPCGEVKDVNFRGQIDYVVMNGNVILGQKFMPEAVCGRHIYSRIV